MKPARFLEDAELVDLRLDVNDLRREHAAMQARLAVVEARIGRTIGPRDDSDCSLVLTIAETAAGTAWSTPELFRHAKTIPALKTALVNAECSSPKKLGKLCGRLEGTTINGLRIERVGEGRAGILWRVVVC